MNKINAYVERLHNPDLAILLLRIALGVVFINAGWMKITNIDMVITGFAQAGIPMVLAYFVAYAEFIGGIALVLGFAVRYFAIILAIIMAVAIFKAHLANGYSLQNGGYEYVLVLFLGAVSLVTSGSGQYSVARFCKKAE
ncbi:DoxX family protein [Patescibacteria group bacterium]|nr:MAG: DoxX family protein [Patescibacteria group bacterium]